MSAVAINEKVVSHGPVAAADERKPAWTKPAIEEQCVALEINDYCSAELDRKQ